MNKHDAVTILLVLALLCSWAVADDEPRTTIDGRWDARYTSTGSAAYTMEFDAGRFHAVERETSYRGEIAIDTSVSPARIDFTILECDCGFLGKTSRGIIRWDGDTIEIRAPAPDDPRPSGFDREASDSLRLTREAHGDPAAGGSDRGD